MCRSAPDVQSENLQCEVAAMSKKGHKVLPALSSFQARLQQEMKSLMRTELEKFAAPAVRDVPLLLGGIRLDTAEQPGPCIAFTFEVTYRAGFITAARTCQRTLPVPAGGNGREQADQTAEQLRAELPAMASEIAENLPAAVSSTEEFLRLFPKVRVHKSTTLRDRVKKAVGAALASAMEENSAAMVEKLREAAERQLRCFAEEEPLPWTAPCSIGDVTVSAQVRPADLETGIMLTAGFTCTASDFSVRRGRSISADLPGLAGMLPFCSGTLQGGELAAFLDRNWEALSTEDLSGVCSRDVPELLWKLTGECTENMEDLLPRGFLIPPDRPGGAPEELWQLVAGTGRRAAKTVICWGDGIFEGRKTVQMDIRKYCQFLDQPDSFLDRPAKARDAAEQLLICRAARRFCAPKKVDIAVQDGRITGLALDGRDSRLVPEKGETVRSWLTRVLEADRAALERLALAEDRLVETLDRLNPSELILLRVIREEGRGWLSGAAEFIEEGHGITTKTSAQDWFNTVTGLKFDGEEGPEPLLTVKRVRSSYGRNEYFLLYRPNPKAPWGALDRAKGRDFTAAEVSSIRSECRIPWISGKAEKARTPDQLWAVLTVLEQGFSASRAAEFAKSPGGRTFFGKFQGPDAEYARFYVEGLPGCRRLAAEIFGSGAQEQPDGGGTP